MSPVLLKIALSRITTQSTITPKIKKLKYKAHQPIKRSEDSVDPEDTGLIVTQTTINNISIEDAWVILRATVTVRNEDQIEYELVELRADAYRTTPNAEKRTALGFDYETKDFDSSSPFGSGTEQFQIEIAILQDEAPRQLNTDWFDVTAVVRRADKA
jgi:hypothetical protein